MYTRRFESAEETTEPVRLPENYHGVAFSIEEAEDAPPEPPEAASVKEESEVEEACCAPSPPPSRHFPFNLPFSSALLSPDLLLLLLAALLMGEGEGMEASAILLFLLLTD